jgi:hypothetical protein
MIINPPTRVNTKIQSDPNPNFPSQYAIARNQLFTQRDSSHFALNALSELNDLNTTNNDSTSDISYTPIIKKAQNSALKVINMIKSDLKNTPNEELLKTLFYAKYIGKKLGFIDVTTISVVSLFSALEKYSEYEEDPSPESTHDAYIHFLKDLKENPKKQEELLLEVDILKYYPSEEETKKFLEKKPIQKLKSTNQPATKIINNYSIAAISYALWLSLTKIPLPLNPILVNLISYLPSIYFIKYT